jgi:iron(III) transport system ATP-binding protein
MVFQDLALWPNLTVRENIRLGLSGLRANRRQIGECVREALEVCGIAALADRLPSQLSGGQQQRAALARAMAVRPQFLLLDEPFAGVDLATKSSILAEIARLADVRPFTIILVSHDPWEALGLCTHAVVMDGGVVQAAGGVRDFLAASPAEPFCAFRALHSKLNNSLVRVPE